MVGNTAIGIAPPTTNKVDGNGSRHHILDRRAKEGEMIGEGQHGLTASHDRLVNLRHPYSLRTIQHRPLFIPCHRRAILLNDRRYHHFRFIRPPWILGVQISRPTALRVVLRLPTAQEQRALRLRPWITISRRETRCSLAKVSSSSATVACKKISSHAKQRFPNTTGPRPVPTCPLRPIERRCSTASLTRCHVLLIRIKPRVDTPIIDQRVISATARLFRRPFGAILAGMCILGKTA